MDFNDWAQFDCVVCGGETSPANGQELTPEDEAGEGFVHTRCIGWLTVDDILSAFNGKGGW